MASAAPPEHLDHLRAIRAAADQASTISTLQDRIDTLVGHTATDTAATHRVSGLSDELGDVREGLTSIVQFLSAYPARLLGAGGSSYGPPAAGRRLLADAGAATDAKSGEGCRTHTKYFAT